MSYKCPICKYVILYGNKHRHYDGEKLVECPGSQNPLVDIKPAEHTDGTDYWLVRTYFKTKLAAAEAAKRYAEAQGFELGKSASRVLYGDLSIYNEED